MTQKYILITGASTGMGRATAELLDKKGYYVFAAVRKEKDAESLRKTCSEKVIPILMDITDKAQIQAGFTKIQQICGENGLFALVNNAGINVSSPIEFITDEQIKQIFDVNFYGLLHVSQIFIPLLRQYSIKNPDFGSRILNLGSIGGYLATPIISLYNATKFAVLALSESLVLELAPSNIEVCYIAPGSVKTAIWEKSYDDADKTVQNLPKEGHELYGKVIDGVLKFSKKTENAGISSEKAAEKIVATIETRKPKFRILIGNDANLFFWFNRLMPPRLKFKFLRKQLGF